MNYLLFLILCTTSLYSIAPANPKPLTQNSAPVSSSTSVPAGTIVNVYASPTSTSSCVNHTHANATQQQEVANSIHMEQYATLKSYFESIGNAVGELPTLWEHFKTECYNQRFYIMGSAGIITYLGLCGILINDNFYLNDESLWARWKFDQPLTSLCIVDEKSLGRELILAIQQRYLDAQNPTNAIKPLTQFIYAIEQEAKRIQRYCTRAGWLKNMQIMCNSSY